MYRSGLVSWCEHVCDPPWPGDGRLVIFHSQDLPEPEYVYRQHKKMQAEHRRSQARSPYVTNPILLKMARMRSRRMSLVRKVKSTIVDAKYPARSSTVIMAIASGKSPNGSASDRTKPNPTAFREVGSRDPTKLLHLAQLTAMQDQPMGSMRQMSRRFLWVSGS